ncbi:MAG: hypothetical protein QXV82_09220 [Ignisphaera sp.]
MSNPIKEFEDIVNRIRTVKSGDWVLSEDYNLKVEALKKFFTCVEEIAGRRVEDIPMCNECYRMLLELKPVGHGDRTLIEFFNRLNEIFRRIKFCLWQITGRLRVVSTIDDLTNALTMVFQYSLTTRTWITVSTLDELTGCLSEVIGIIVRTVVKVSTLDDLVGSLIETVNILVYPRYVVVTVTDVLTQSLSEVTRVYVYPKTIVISPFDNLTGSLSETTVISLIPKTIVISPFDNLTGSLSETVTVTVQ